MKKHIYTSVFRCYIIMYIFLMYLMSSLSMKTSKRKCERWKQTVDGVSFPPTRTGSLAEIQKDVEFRIPFTVNNSTISVNVWVDVIHQVAVVTLQLLSFHLMTSSFILPTGPLVTWWTWCVYWLLSRRNKVESSHYIHLESVFLFLEAQLGFSSDGTKHFKCTLSNLCF